ncbi:hypothetical protein [Pisciglobus halotolerans]|uniref:Uncharacterized protein n=1 Tax=Pisciglobus halotolerans TaxID=745365 RepID=A0A1I3DLR8_9LACT|nr:hypothetical protein [Pisciglobus halotolerans]SFH87670.1 hypothetical protein SAMN04489868_14310 [Pisciglobus halotolerans]
MVRYNDYQETSKQLKKIDHNKNNYLIIHYSCESFYDNNNGKSPRITSIAVRKLDDGQTDLFAIHKIAEIKKINFIDIDTAYNKLGKEMLKRFFIFVEKNSHKNWIHWNMRDSNYGFKAIEHRYEVLGGKPTIIPDEKKIDLAKFFSQRFTKGYASHPRIESLIKMNNIKPKDFLSGKDEAQAFKEKNFVKLSMSTASKVDIFSNFLTLAIENKLVTKTPKKG